jgi:hypothetical protein
VNGSFDWQPVECPLTGDDVVERLTLRYETAFAEYQDIVIKNTELNMTRGKLSWEAQREEELAFDELDSARYALLNAAALADPTIH